MIGLDMWRRGFWVRVPSRGWGLHVMFARGHLPSWSERNGVVKAFYFAGLRFRVLRPL